MSAGVHRLVTGLNGHGKTLYAVSQICKPALDEPLQIGTGAEKTQLNRRLVVGGIKDLLLPHELMDVPKFDPENFKDEFRDLVREPGDPPLPVAYNAQCWWAWCLPGDLIVIDECQRLFRPMASGRRVPMFIEKLETARHYGVQFVYITQHPQLLHTNVRNLVGPHEHVRRIFGGTRTMIYQWDHCTHPDRINSALTNRIWAHDKAAFGLYKSAEVHTKFGTKLPMAVWALLIGVICLAALIWFMVGRFKERFSPQPQTPLGATAVAPGAVAQPAQKATSSNNSQAGQASKGRASSSWPVLVATSPDGDRDPYAQVGLHMAGCWGEPGALRCVFTVSVDGVSRTTVSLEQLRSAGYAWREWGPCAGVLSWAGRERAVTCDAPAPQVVAAGQQATTQGAGVVSDKPSKQPGTL